LTWLPVGRLRSGSWTVQAPEHLPEIRSERRDEEHDDQAAAKMTTSAMTSPVCPFVEPIPEIVAAVRIATTIQKAFGTNRYTFVSRL
jgi:hypothetical protein